jgi:hypothetical protein
MNSVRPERPQVLRSRPPSPLSIRRRAIISATRSTSSKTPCDASDPIVPIEAVVRPISKRKPATIASGKGEARGSIMGSGLVGGITAPRSDRRRARLSDILDSKDAPDASTHGRKQGVAFRHLCCVRGARFGGVFGDRSGGLGGSLPLAWRFAGLVASDACPHAVLDGPSRSKDEDQQAELQLEAWREPCPFCHASSHSASSTANRLTGSAQVLPAPERLSKNFPKNCGSARQRPVRGGRCGALQRLF